MSAARDARDVILGRLRQALDETRSPFRGTGGRTVLPDPPNAVMRAEGDARSLARTFGTRLQDVDGSYEIVERLDSVAQRITQLTRDYGGASQRHEILSWAPDYLSVPNLAQQLDASGIALFVPEDLHAEPLRARAAVATVGLTAVDAAFAATGSVVLCSGPGKPRAASLLPLHHIVLVPFSRIYPTVEAWVQNLRDAGRGGTFFSNTAQVVVVTGPSKSADIELNLTLGVHGPRVVHALVFDDGAIGSSQTQRQAGR